ncbi:hypothetical protein PENTCL1PPCAC_28646 [Pristionchus entomophagus]|uniref:Uncharacterized protein n=1 Tax=Pristionchus entomophagus TaxID=358040 RepID=A0AAV5UHN5_9BILA|nr:hypothetical protein PENTCL1PPCAC_28646 [Pristionchus entomophagus]
MKGLAYSHINEPMEREISISQCSMFPSDGFEEPASNDELLDLSEGKFVDGRPTPAQFEMNLANHKVRVTKTIYASFAAADRQLEDMLSAEQSLNLAEVVCVADTFARCSFALPATEIVLVDPVEDRLRREQKERRQRRREERKERKRIALEEQIESERMVRRGTQKLRFASDTIFRVSRKRVMSSESIIRGYTGVTMEETLAGPEKLPDNAERVQKFLDQESWNSPSTSSYVAPPTNYFTTVEKRPSLIHRAIKAIRRSMMRKKK